MDDFCLYVVRDTEGKGFTTLESLLYEKDVPTSKKEGERPISKVDLETARKLMLEVSVKEL